MKPCSQSANLVMYSFFRFLPQTSAPLLVMLLASSHLMAVTPVISAGAGHSLFLRADGSVTAAGLNDYGQLGDGSKTNNYQTNPILSGVLAVSAGNGHSLFLKADGSAWVSGRNDSGQLGKTTTQFTPTTPAQTMTGVQAVAAGHYHSLFLKTDGTVWAAGKNNDGQLGTGNSSNVTIPVQVMAGVQAISAGSSHSLFLKTDGTAWAAGRNASGQLGKPSTVTWSPTPVQVMSGVSAISAGVSHSLFLKADGTVWGAGSNGNGELGDGTRTQRNTPIQIFSGADSISAGGYHSLFLKTDGTTWATGSYWYGQLGDGNYIQGRGPGLYTDGIVAPVQVLAGVRAISGGLDHTLFLKLDGTLWSTGNNQYRQLADFSATLRRFPTQQLQLGLAPTVAAPTVTDVTGTSAILGGNVTGDGESTITARGLVISSYTNDPYRGGVNVADSTTPGTTGTFVVNPTNLLPSTTYYLRAYATNTVGTTYSSSVQFSTLSNFAGLSNLSLSVGSLAPAFLASRYAYSATVPVATASFTVTATRLGVQTIKVNGVLTASGTPSDNIPLSPGSNSITVRVTAQDGITTRDYVINVTRANLAPTVIFSAATNIGSSSASLGGQVASDGGSEILDRGIVVSPAVTNPNPLPGGDGVLTIPGAGTTGGFTIPVTGLISSTAYAYKAYATNSTGTTYTPVATFTTLTDSADPAVAWQQARFGADAGNPLIAGPGADPDKDGIVNLLERAFNLSPLQAAATVLTSGSGTTGLPLVGTTQGPDGPLITIQYLRRKASTNSGLTYTPQFSSSLEDSGPIGWSSATGTETVVSIDSEWERVTITDTAPASTTRFGRVKVTASP